MMEQVSKSSVIRAMFEEGKRLAGIYGAENVYDFSLGNPNVEAPEEVKKAILEILQEEKPAAIHGYMNNSGYDDVREAIAQNLNKRFGTGFNSKNILMTVGAAGGLNVVFKTLLNPGDEVITFAPFFGEYNSYASNFDAKLVIVPPNTVDFQPNLDAFSSLITEKTKAVIVNSPNNPTGVVYSEATIMEGAFYMFVKAPVADDKAFAELAKAKNILLVPGSAFGCPGYVRIAYCVAYSTIENALPGFKALIEECRSQA